MLQRANFGLSRRGQVWLNANCADGIPHQIQGWERGSVQLRSDGSGDVNLYVANNPVNRVGIESNMSGVLSKGNG